MKKLLSILVTLVLVSVIFVGCTEEAAPEDPKTGAYEDGTYIAHDVRDSRGNYGTIEITVANGEITEVNYAEINGKWAAPKNEDNYNYGDYFTAAESLPQQLIDTQSIDEVDTVSGATSTSDTFRALAEKALNEDPGTYYDGTWLATGDPSHGWTPFVYVTFEDDEIVEVVYDELNEEGLWKTDPEAEYGYTQVFDAIEQLEDQFMATKNVEEVDVVSGATTSSESFKAVVQEAIDRATVE